MSLRRVAALVRLDLREYRGRPLLWVWTGMLVLIAWQMSKGELSIATGGNTIGGTKAFLTSEFSMASLCALTVMLFHVFFVAIVAGLPVIRDRDAGVADLLHTTPLRRSEYIWGKFGGALLTCLAVLAFQVALVMFFNHLMPTTAAAVRGPFALGNYLWPALLFSLPLVVFAAGAAFALGTASGLALMVFVLPVALLLASMFFFWGWSTDRIGPTSSMLIDVADPSGYRWLQQTYLAVDRGADYYNRTPVGFTTAFVVSRAVLVALGFGLVALVARAPRARAVVGKKQPPPPAEEPQGRLGPLGMTTTRRSALADLLLQVRFQLGALCRQKGLYVFVPVILLVALPSALEGNGPFDSDLLPTPGFLAERSMPTVFLCLVFLLLFYTVESLERDGRARLEPLVASSPLPTSAWLLGHITASGLLGLGVLAVGYLGCLVVMALSGSPWLGPRPFLLLWGLLGFPTILVWTAFVALAWTVTRNRFTTYGAGLGVMLLTAWSINEHKGGWVASWLLWKACLWSDISPLEVDRRILILNRLFMLALAVLFARAALAVHRRREGDAVGRTPLGKRPILWPLVRNAPFWLPALVLGLVVWVYQERGAGGAQAHHDDKDYWRQNLETYGRDDFKVPDLSFVDLDVDLDPAAGSMRLAGSYDLVNNTHQPLHHIPLSVGRNVRSPGFTMNGQDYTPEDRSGLRVFTPPRPLAPGERLRLGFRYTARLPDGPSDHGGEVGEFILPSSVVLHCLGDTFTPSLGWNAERGVDQDNRTEQRVYDDDYYAGETEGSSPGFNAAFRTRIRVTTPADFRANAVGELKSETVTNGRREVVWESDQPVHIFNVVAGRYQVAKGDGVELYFDARHHLNVPEMLEALQAARRLYGQWFYPLPWKTLKLSEHAGVVMRAMGFPSNIIFSESIGFLAPKDSEDHLVFWITAHETAHQWWPNLVVPADGPASNILSEGLSHFSAMLLMEAVKGEEARMKFSTRIERHYDRGRDATVEQPLLKVDSSSTRRGVSVVWYDRGRWAFWMLMQHLGRERMFAGLHQYVERYRDNPDHPATEDLLAILRAHSTDPAAFDAFVTNWFAAVTLPRFEVLSASRRAQGTRWQVSGRLRNAATGTVTVDVAATTGQRFDKDGHYQDARTTVRLGPGAITDFTIDCAFKPDQVVVDPDVMVLQVGRPAARRELKD